MATMEGEVSMVTTERVAVTRATVKGGRGELPWRNYVF